MYKGWSKSSKRHPGRRFIAEYFCYINTLPLLIKLEKKLILLSRWGPHKDERFVMNGKHDQTENRGVIKYQQKKGRITKEILDDIVLILSVDSFSHAIVKKWEIIFKLGKDSIKDDSLSGRPKTSTTNKQVNPIHPIVLDDRCYTVQHMPKSIGISSDPFPTILTQNFGDD